MVCMAPTATAATTPYRHVVERQAAVVAVVRAAHARDALLLARVGVSGARGWRRRGGERRGALHGLASWSAHRSTPGRMKDIMSASTTPVAQ